MASPDRKEEISENEQLAIALRQLVEHKRNVIRKREKEAEIKKNQGLPFKFKMTLFTILGSGLGMLGAFVFHDMIKESLGSGVNRFVASIWKWSTGKDCSVSVRASEFAKEGCLGPKIMARVIYIILILAIVVPLIILVTAGKTDAETSERKRIEKLMILKKKADER